MLSVLRSGDVSGPGVLSITVVTPLGALCPLQHEILIFPDRRKYFTKHQSRVPGSSEAFVSPAKLSCFLLN